MKNFFLIAATVALALMGTGCNKTDNGNENPGGGDEPGDEYLTVTAENILFLSSKATTAKLSSLGEMDDENSAVIAEAPIENNGFTVTLDMQPKAMYGVFDEEHMDFDGMSVSNPDVLGIAPALFVAYDNVGQILDPIIYGNVTDTNISYMMWIYVTDDVTVKGSQTDKDDEYMEMAIYSMNLTLKAGWNALVMSIGYGEQGGYDTLTVSYDSEASTEGFFWLSAAAMGRYSTMTPHTSLMKKWSR
jgi:hypothetical protein